MKRLRCGVVAGVSAVLAAALLSVSPSPASPDPFPDWEPKDPDLTTPWTSDVGPDNALPEYPRPQLTRARWQNLNGLWQFQAASAGDAPPIGQRLEEDVLVPYPIESALSGIKRHEDRMFYRRTFTVPKKWNVAKRNGERLLLHFDAVDYDAEVWVNGDLATEHRGGYDGFSVDVTGHLRKHGRQEIVVGVTDRTAALEQPVGKQRNAAIENPGGIFYTPASGIWQTVWMEPVRRAHIDDVKATTRPNLRQVDVTVDADAASEHTVRLRALRNGKVVATGEGEPGSPIRLTIPRPKLWSPDHPNLYDLDVTLQGPGNRKVDRVGSYFGMRTVDTVVGEDGKRHVVLNGEPIFVNSTLDQGYWPDGIYTAPTDEGLAFDLKAHKRLGFNAVRKHIKVEPDRWYYWADRLGLMVWQDMPSLLNGQADPEPAAQKQFEDELHTMLDQHSGWTSIIGWVPFNEGWGEWDRQETGRIAEAVKAADPTRLVNAHSGVNCCDSEGDSGKGDIIDWHAYTGPAAPGATADRAAIDGEHGGYGLVVEDHLWPGEPGAYQMAESKRELTDLYVENQTKLLELSRKCGLSGGIYTQITDVETEVNGFFTYDRQVSKMFRKPVREINEKLSHSGNLGQPPPDPGDGTPGIEGIHRWTLDDGSGATAADSVGEADLSVQDGATWEEGKSGQALAFGGTGFAETDDPVVDTEGNFSVSAWVKLDETGGGFQTAVSQDGDDASAFFLQYDGGQNKFAFSTTSGRAYASEEAESGRWYHLVGVRDIAEGTYTLYVDGQEQATLSQCMGLASTGPLAVGRAKFGGENVDVLGGSVDDVRVYDRPLAADEVTELFDGGGAR